MLKQIEGSRAVAEAIALCRPQVICAYPITPQTHIVEGLGELVKTDELGGCEFINVESEFAALSVAGVSFSAISGADVLAREQPSKMKMPPITSTWSATTISTTFDTFI